MLLKSLDQLSDFISTVDARRIPREKPFAGSKCGPLFVVGPSVTFYEQMLAELTVTNGLSKAARLLQAEESLSDDFLEYHSQYAIDENNETSPTNNTSTIMHLSEGDRVFLFTGDAGVQALNNARLSYNFSNVYWLDVPHHGSRRNLRENGNARPYKLA